MIAAVAVALLAVALGVALALVPAASGRLVGPIKSFALTASLSVVLAHLLPEAFTELGSVAFAVFVAGALAPTLLAGIARRASGTRPIGLEIGYAGLIVHTLGDGLGMGAYAGPLSGGGAEIDVLVALAAHTVPVVAVVVIAFESAYGRRAALFRALWIAIATLVGVALTGLVPAEAAHAAGAWVAAAVSGLLLHVAMHDLGSHAPENASERTLDLIGALLGLAVPLLSVFEHPPGHDAGAAEALASRLGSTFIDLWLTISPLLIAGLLASALVHSIGSRRSSPPGATRGTFREAVSGALFAAGRPASVCRISGVASELGGRARPALVVAFVLAAPELGIETLALGAGMLGVPFALLRLASALIVAIVVAIVVSKLAQRHKDPHAAQAHAHEPAIPALGTFDELLHHIGAWMVAGIAVAALADVLIADRALSGSAVIELCAITAVALPAYVCAPAATPLAAVLIAKGVSPGALLVGLVLGAATNLATLRLLAGLYGRRALLTALATAVALAWALSLAANALLTAGVDVHRPSTDHPAWAIASGALLALLLLRSVWLSGVRGFVGSLAELGGAAASSHHHPHGAH